MLNRRILNKILYYVILIALYTISFIVAYEFIGSFAGTMGIVFILVIAHKFKYIDVIVFGLILNGINVYLRFVFQGNYNSLNNTIINHLFIIAIGLLVVYLIEERLLIQKQYIEIEEAYEKLKESNIALEQEIIQRVNIEKRLKENERQLRSAIDQCPVHVMLHAEDGQVLEISRVCTDITGYTIQDVPTTLKWSQMVLGIETDVLDDSLSKLKNLGDRKNNGEYKIITKYGDVRIWDSYSAYIGKLHDGCKIFMRVAIDITERKHMEELEINIEQERKILNEIMEYDRIKTEFFANLSHEFRTPIHVIFSALQLHELKLKTCVSEDHSTDFFKHTKVMKQNCYRLLRLVNNLIDITKIDTGYFEINESNHDIISLIENITISVADYVESRGLSLIFDTDVEEKIMACDPEKIERIMMNLLSNAVKFTPPGGDIMVTVQDGIENICIRVKDTGRGIPEEKLNSIFERFIQVDKSLSRDHEGSGIGLSLVKSLVELHGGTIYVESKEAEGTEFIICIPCKVANRVVDDQVICSADISGNYIERINIEFSDIYN